MNKLNSFSLASAICRALLLALISLAPISALAAPTATEVVKQTSDELLADLKANKEL